MGMPEASVNENYLFPGRKNEIRFSWKIPPVQPVAVAHTVYELANDHFWLHVLTADRSHICAAPQRVNLVSHLLGFYLLGRGIYVEASVKPLSDPYRWRGGFVQGVWRS